MEAFEADVLELAFHGRTEWFLATLIRLMSASRLSRRTIQRFMTNFYLGVTTGNAQINSSYFFFFDNKTHILY